MTIKLKANKAIVFVACLILIATISIGIPIKAQTGDPDEPEYQYASHQVIVKLAPGVDIEDLNLGQHYSVLEDESQLNSYLLSVVGLTEQQAVQELSAKPGVSFAELNMMFTTMFVPNDPLYQYQYGPKNINCEDAWDSERGEESVIVSVIDTGIDYTHHDLVDNYRPLGSWNFISHNPYPLDDNGHGTHCAGIIAAEIDNGIGISGIANVEIVSMKVLDEYGSGFLFTVVRGIVRSGLVGADIISMSIGGYRETPPKLLWAACNFSYNLGVVIVAASGNGGSEDIAYPARFPNVIAVGAVDENNERASFSDYGADLEVMAPGVDICSTMPTYWVTLNDMGYDLQYANLSGTSMACPHVAGALALFFSQNGVETSNSVAREKLHESSIDLGTAGFDIYNGYGLVNASGILGPLDGGGVIKSDKMSISKIAYMLR